jgi:hypothetical protein
MGYINEKAVDYTGQEVRAELLTVHPGTTSTVTQITNRSTGAMVINFAIIGVN